MAPPSCPSRTRTRNPVPVLLVADEATVLVPAIPGQDHPAEPEARPAAALVDFARRIAAEHHDSHGHPITRDTLRARLGVSNQLASDLLHQIRTTPGTP